METQEIYKKAIEHWGEELQVGMLMEEMAELTIAINKLRRHRKSENQVYIENVIEEIADVKIMLEQIQVLFKISNYQINCQYQKKLMKLEKMINGKVD